MIVEVEHNATKHRYEVFADGRFAGFATYRLEDDRVLFLHTAVDDAYKGRGLAHQLIRHALAEVRADGKTPVPVCPFVAGVLEPESQLVGWPPVDAGRSCADQSAAAL
jgi:predicted GNAT family acetyltransferase